MRSFIVIAAAVLTLFSAGCSNGSKDGGAEAVRTVVASDTILSTMIVSLLPPTRYSVEAVLPPGQCPGQYDVKLSDVERMKKADLIVSFKGMPYMDKKGMAGKAEVTIEAHGRNWMAPDSYIYGLGLLADRLSEHFPEDKDRIERRKAEAVRAVRSGADSLRERIGAAGIAGKPVIASSMQKEPVEWMGFRVVAEYGRPEAMSAREVVRLSRIGKECRAVLVVDNLQSGPDAGRGVAETLRTPHVVLTNFPSEKGYLATLGENVDTVLAAVRK